MDEQLKNQLLILVREGLRQSSHAMVQMEDNKPIRAYEAQKLAWGAFVDLNEILSGK